MEHRNTLNTKIGILGVGAIGSVIAHHLLSNSSNAIFYYSRTPKTSLKLQIDGIFKNTSIHVTTLPNQTQDLDWLIICLQEHQFPHATSWFLNLINPETFVIVIRNGLNLKTPLLEFTKRKHILEGIIDCSTQLTENGYYHCSNSPTLYIPQGHLSRLFKSLFSSNIQIKEVEDFKTECWKKLCESATLGGILCMHNDTCRIFKNKTIQLEYINLINECIQVAKADGAHIKKGFTELMLQKTLCYPPDKGSSMLFAMRHRKTIELGAKNGIICQLGQQYQIATPINDSVIRLLQ